METVLLYAIGVAVIVVGLAVSIGLHEVGHLVPAKLFGIKVTQYMIGFGGTLFSWRRGETEYGFKLLPLGGYISMIGMYPPRAPGESPSANSTGFVQALDETQRRRTSRIDGLVTEARAASAATIGAGEDHRAFYQQPVWKRIVVMVGGPAMNLLLAIVFYGIVLVGFGIPQATTTVAAINECVISASDDRAECAPGDPRSPASEAGLLPGDRIASIDGSEVQTWDQASSLIAANPERTVPLIVERDGALVELEVTPMLTERAQLAENGAPLVDENGDQVFAEQGFVGFAPEQVREQQSVTSVLPAVGENIAGVGRVIVTLPQHLFATAQAIVGVSERDENGPMSVVGVGRIAGELVSLDEVPVEARIASLVQLLASLNVALFLFNLLPLMPLDGGHIVTALWEKIKRSVARLRGRPDPGPVDGAKAVPVTMVVAVLMVGMFALLVVADIVTPISIL